MARRTYVVTAAGRQPDHREADGIEPRELLAVVQADDHGTGDEAVQAYLALPDALDCSDLSFDPLPPVGARVRLKQDVERYPFFICSAGSLGTVDEVPKDKGDVFGVRMDDDLEGCEEWDNCIMWADIDLPYALTDLEVLENDANVPPPPAPSDNRITAAITAALGEDPGSKGGFWQVIVDRFPEVRSGDMGPGEVDTFEVAAREVLGTWLRNNHPGLSEFDTDHKWAAEVLERSGVDANVVGTGGGCEAVEIPLEGGTVEGRILVTSNREMTGDAGWTVGRYLTSDPGEDLDGETVTAYTQLALVRIVLELLHHPGPAKPSTERVWLERGRDENGEFVTVRAAQGIHLHGTEPGRYYLEPIA